jgi:hypothetical protein
MTVVGPALTPDERAAVRLVIELVDLLAARHGFDPTELVNPRTGRPLGPALTRMREALREGETEGDPPPEPQAGGPRPRRQERASGW